MTPHSIADFAIQGLRRGAPDFRVLYKYQTISQYSIDALRNGYLYFSSFAQLNDPFDPFMTLMASHLPEVGVAVLEKGPKIFCVTAEPFHPLMWAHYANSYAGMRIGYAVFVGNPRLFNPVKYVSDFSGRYNIMELLMLKHAHWEGEAEWRACFPGDEHKYHGIAHPISVCLGPRATTADMEMVRDALPDTVRDFEIIFPIINESRPEFATYDISAITSHYGKIPSLEELFTEKG